MDLGPAGGLGRVLADVGNFASEGEGQLFPLDLLEQATTRDLDAAGEGIVLGVDCARSLNGDKNALAVAQGGRLLKVVTWQSADTMTTVARVIHEVAQHRPALVRVDESGVGAGVVDRLRELRYPVQGVAFGGAARERSRFRNQRAEMFWELRTRLEQGTACLPDDPALLADLSALTFRFAADGRVQLDSKDEVRARLGRSPDRGDAVALAIGAGGRPLPPLRRGSFSLSYGGLSVRWRDGRMGHEQAYPSPFAVPNVLPPPPRRPAA
jgi:hypothetical protein